MDTNRIRTYAAWTSLGTEVFLVALAIAIRLLPRGFLPDLSSELLAETGVAVLIIAGILGLPRWPAVVALGSFGLFAFLYGVPDSCTPRQERYPPIHRSSNPPIQP
jgi:hypothetical protein